VGTSFHGTLTTERRRLVFLLPTWWHGGATAATPSPPGQELHDITLCARNDVTSMSTIHD